MAEGTEENKQPNKYGTDSKLMRTLLVILAALFTFAGPTFLTYAMITMLKLEYFLSMASGAVIFVVGLVLIWYLMRRQALS